MNTLTPAQRETLRELADGLPACDTWRLAETDTGRDECGNCAGPRLAHDTRAALRAALVERTCGTCQWFVPWFKDGATANGYPEQRGDCKHRKYLGRRNGQSPDDGCVKGWSPREDEGGRHA